MVSDPADIARDIIDASLYMVLATADETGRPWASPVYFAHLQYAEFFWVSSPEAAHSRNIAVRPQVSIAIFDSTAPIRTGQGVYMSAVAHEVTGADLDRAVEVFSRRSLAHGDVACTREDVQAEAEVRLYRAAAQDHFILAKDGRPDHRIAARLENGSSADLGHCARFNREKADRPGRSGPAKAIGIDEESGTAS